MATAGPARACMQQDEFEALPVSIQRKFFSDLERLRIAEKSALQRSRSHRATTIPQPRPSLHHRRKSSAVYTTANLTRADTRSHRLQKPRSVRDEYFHIQREVQWFIALPDKVRRQIFSQEEQVLLSAWCDQYIAPEPSVNLSRFAPEGPEPQVVNFSYPNRQRQQAALVRASLEKEQRSLSDDSSIYDHTEDSLDDSSAISDEMASCFGDSTQFSGSPLNSRHSRKSSVRRTLSINSNNFPRQSTSSIPPIPHSPMSPAFKRSGGGSTSYPFPPPENRPSMDPAAIHYRDPEARMKLRQYATPQKFDEAIEYGFPTASVPSTPSTHAVDLGPLNFTPLTLSQDLQTFMRDDWLSFLDGPNAEHEEEEEAHGEEDEDDEASLPDAESPVTPPSSAQMFTKAGATRLPSSNFSSIDSACLPQTFPKRTDSFGPSLPANREMTMRMTLTRPDLRADDEALYGWQGRTSNSSASNDLLALEDLVITDDATGAQGAFAVKNRRTSVMKKILGRVSHSASSSKEKR
ncbi:hypothetical protein K402DRAFT_418422 [Aulographum hederae CBS 113979]|uniref:Uncharacterized protein n=1 Tax=Aulographum hederae CBS 113979 TaxID=1176131 RepID=A0A6G1H9H3_9PEZI|nr:hypothetical protein K402DRAFT_418422 [Aulographum hederae CBS 113979]